MMKLIDHTLTVDTVQDAFGQFLVIYMGFLAIKMRSFIEFCQNNYILKDDGIWSEETQDFFEEPEPMVYMGLNRLILLASPEEYGPDELHRDRIEEREKEPLHLWNTLGCIRK